MELYTVLLETGCSRGPTLTLNGRFNETRGRDKITFACVSSQKAIDFLFLPHTKLYDLSMFCNNLPNFRFFHDTFMTSECFFFSFLTSFLPARLHRVSPLCEEAPPEFDGRRHGARKRGGAGLRECGQCHPVSLTI